MLLRRILAHSTATPSVTPSHRQLNQRVATNEIAITLTAYTLNREVGLEEEVLVVDKR